MYEITVVKTYCPNLRHRLAQQCSLICPLFYCNLLALLSASTRLESTGCCLNDVWLNYMWGKPGIPPAAVLGPCMAVLLASSPCPESLPPPLLFLGPPHPQKMPQDWLPVRRCVFLSRLARCLCSCGIAAARVREERDRRANPVRPSGWTQSSVEEAGGRGEVPTVRPTNQPSFFLPALHISHVQRFNAWGVLRSGICFECWY